MPSKCCWIHRYTCSPQFFFPLWWNTQKKHFIVCVPHMLCSVHVALSLLGEISNVACTDSMTKMIKEFHKFGRCYKGTGAEKHRIESFVITCKLWWTLAIAKYRNNGEHCEKISGEWEKIVFIFPTTILWSIWEWDRWHICMTIMRYTMENSKQIKPLIYFLFQTVSDIHSFLSEFFFSIRCWELLCVCVCVYA